MKKDKILKQYFVDTSKIIASKYDRSKSVKHKGSKGKDREIFIQDFLKRCFPRKSVIGSGEILDSENKVSKQCDVIVYDEHMPVFDYGDTKQFLSGGVLAHIEVKTKLTKKEFRKALEVVSSVKELKRDVESSINIGDIPKSIFSCIFAYDSVDINNIQEEFEDFYQDISELNCVLDAICVLNKWVLVKNIKGKKKYLVFLDTKDESLMVFFVKLFNAIQKNWLGMPSMLRYLGELEYRTL